LNKIKSAFNALFIYPAFGGNSKSLRVFITLTEKFRANVEMRVKGGFVIESHYSVCQYCEAQQALWKKL